jgi:hypothetical protein
MWKPKMKYIIGESRLDKLIYDFIDKEINNDNLNYEFLDGFDGSTPSTAYFFNGDYDEERFDGICFWFGPNYWGDDPEERKFKETSPNLEIKSSDITKKFDSIFGDKWKPVFLQWFNDKFPDFGAKSIINRTIIYRHR